ncbi:MAG: hypothetical protein JWM74_333 [Myxococcaceae bacterium]|jgi:hypothetical protein|nr:hypothetical protein [Myxococcaceae bacterium]
MNQRTLLHRTSVRASLLVALAAGALSFFACASVPDETRYTQVLAPDPAQFQAGVSFFLERRCGTLDCHGQPGRPLRIYGARGLRKQNDAALTPISGDTSVEEIAANYRSVIALEPEAMSRVVAADGALPERLLLIRKPIDIGEGGERHKGGPVISRGSDGYRCLTSWLANETAQEKCTAAANAF